MDLKNYFYTIFRSLNPESYSELTGHSLGRAVKYFFFITILTSIIMFLLFIPAFMGVSASLHEKAQNFEYLDANFSIKLKEPFVLTEDPLVRVSDAGNLSDEKFLKTAMEDKDKKQVIRQLLDATDAQLVEFVGFNATITKNKLKKEKVL